MEANMASLTAAIPRSGLSDERRLKDGASITEGQMDELLNQIHVQDQTYHTKNRESTAGPLRHPKRLALEQLSPRFHHQHQPADHI